jgi:hypothetical protein
MKYTGLRLLYFITKLNYSRFEASRATLILVFWVQTLSGTLLVPDISEKCTAIVFRVEEF